MSFCDYEMDTFSLNCFLIAETDQKKTPGKKKLMLLSRKRLPVFVHTAMRYLTMKQQTRKKLQFYGYAVFFVKRNLNPGKEQYHHPRYVFNMVFIFHLYLVR